MPGALVYSVLVGVSVIALVGLTQWAATADKDASRFDFAFSAGGAYLSLPAVNRFSTAIDNGPFVFLRQFDGTTALQESLRASRSILARRTLTAGSSAAPI